jgi:Holliday junction resolvase RusA-like endonuclease
LIHQINIEGHVPAKKNLLRPRKNATKGHSYYYDPEVKARLNEIDSVISDYWDGRAPLVNPIIVYVFWTVTGRSDRDNKQTTIQDALVNAGILKDDSINEYSEKYLIWDAGWGKEHTSVFVAEKGTSLEEMIQHVEETLKVGTLGSLLADKPQKSRQKKERIKLL